MHEVGPAIVLAAIAISVFHVYYTVLSQSPSRKKVQISTVMSIIVCLFTVLVGPLSFVGAILMVVINLSNMFGCKTSKIENGIYLVGLLSHPRVIAQFFSGYTSFILLRMLSVLFWILTFVGVQFLLFRYKGSKRRFLTKLVMIGLLLSCFDSVIVGMATTFLIFEFGEFVYIEASEFLSSTNSLARIQTKRRDSKVIKQV